MISRCIDEKTPNSLEERVAVHADRLRPRPRRKQVIARAHRRHLNAAQIIPIAQEGGTIIPACRHTGQNSRGSRGSRKPACRLSYQADQPPLQWSVPEHWTDAAHFARNRAVTPGVLQERCRRPIQRPPVSFDDAKCAHVPASFILCVPACAQPLRTAPGHDACGSSYVRSSLAGRCMRV